MQKPKIQRKNEKIHNSASHISFFLVHDEFFQLATVDCRCCYDLDDLFLIIILYDSNSQYCFDRRCVDDKTHIKDDDNNNQGEDDFDHHNTTIAVTATTTAAAAAAAVLFLFANFIIVDLQIIAITRITVLYKEEKL